MTMFISLDPWSIIFIFMFSLARLENIVPATPRVDFIERPTTAMSAMPFSTVTLLAEGNRLTGVGACNRLTGAYKTDGKRTLKIGPLAATMMACPGMDEEDAFTKMLESVTHYDMDGPMLLLLSDGELRAVFQARP